MLRRLTIGLMAVVVLVVLTAPAALADHNGPYCQAEELSGDRVTFESGNHDYCAG